MKNMIISALLLAVPFTVFAQLKVYRNGDVTIGRAASSEVSKLAVGGTVTTQGVIIPITDSQQESAMRLSEEETLSSIMSMDVITYSNPIDNDNDTDGVLPTRHYAISPKSLLQLYPSLVYEENDSVKGVNYTALVPLLLRCIQELQLQVQTLRTTVETLESGTQQTSANKQFTATLSQNSPNPAHGLTTIDYTIEGTFTTAFIRISDIYGGVVKSIPLKQGVDSVVINASELSAGLYLYTLIVDGLATDSKKMTVVR